MELEKRQLIKNIESQNIACQSQVSNVDEQENTLLNKFVFYVRLGFVGCLGSVVAALVYVIEFVKPGATISKLSLKEELSKNVDFEMSYEEWNEIDEISKKVVRRFASLYLIEVSVDELWEWVGVPEPSAMEWLLMASVDDQELLDMVKLWTLTH